VIIDFYILKKFANTFFFAVIAFVIIYITVDLIENLDNFFDHNATGAVIFKYYLNYIPDIVHLVVPISMLLAGLFTIGKLDTTHELTAVRASGRSIPRIVLPLLVFSLLISLCMTYFNGFLVPISNKKRYELDRQYLGRNLIGSANNVTMRVSGNTSLIVESFDLSNKTAKNVSVEKFTQTDLSKFNLSPKSGSSLLVSERIDAEQMKYDSAKKQWVLLNGVSRNLTDPIKIYTHTFLEKPIPFLKISPSKINLLQFKETELTIAELRERINYEESGGRDIIRLLVEYYNRISFSFAPLVVAFFGFPFSSNQRKSGAAMQIAIGALISAIYLVLSEVTKALCYSNVLPPLLGAWVANLFFLLIGIYNLFRAEQR